MGVALWGYPRSFREMPQRSAVKMKMPVSINWDGTAGLSIQS